MLHFGKILGPENEAFNVVHFQVWDTHEKALLALIMCVPIFPIIPKTNNKNSSIYKIALLYDVKWTGKSKSSTSVNLDQIRAKHVPHVG